MKRIFIGALALGVCLGGAHDARAQHSSSGQWNQSYSQPYPTNAYPQAPQHSGPYSAAHPAAPAPRMAQQEPAYQLASHPTLTGPQGHRMDDPAPVFFAQQPAQGQNQHQQNGVNGYSHNGQERIDQRQMHGEFHGSVQNGHGYQGPMHAYGSAPHSVVDSYKGGFAGSSFAGSHIGGPPCDVGSCDYFTPAHARRFNISGGARALIFKRDYEDDRAISYTTLWPGYIHSTDADVCHMGGVEAFLALRHASGFGVEGVYWGLYDAHGHASLYPQPQTALIGFGSLTIPSYGVSVLDVYNAASYHEIYRHNEFHNFELNLLRNAGTYCGPFGRSTNLEMLVGFRHLRFEEFFCYTSYSNDPGMPYRTCYDIDVLNRLSGVQFGGRSETCVTKRLRTSIGTKVGVFNNRICYNQGLYADGEVAQIATGAYAGSSFHRWSGKDDVSMLGELDLGGSFQFTRNLRATGGYRVIGITGVALAPNQIPNDFSDIYEIDRVNSNGSLLLHGVYVGLDWCF